ncbi:MAG: hypothetical protein HWD59_07535 [Coxiellaceae bacterium]|nr:MAG: hypothetical protein HWD59_07535 [Coxiellaceae bacterium]
MAVICSFSGHQYFFTAITGLYLTPNQTLSLKPGIVLVIFIAGALVFLFITAMIYHYVHVMLQGNLPSLIESFRRAKQRYLSLLLMTFYCW